MYAYVLNAPTGFRDPLGLHTAGSLGSDVEPPPAVGAAEVGSLAGRKAAEQSCGQWPTTVVGWWHAIEGPLYPFLVGSAALSTGLTVTAAGAVTTVAVVAAVPTTGGISLILVPGSVGVTLAGIGLVTYGTDVHINEANKLLGTRMPGPGDFLPLPRWPAEPSKGHC
jgi:hypothetical protein